MRTLLATLLLGPVLAVAQVPARPPPAPRPLTPAPAAAPTPGAPTPPARPPGPAGGVPIAPAVGTPAAAAPTPAGTPAIRADTRCTPIQGRFLLSFNKADILDVLEQASRWTCRNFIYSEDIAKGKITLLSKTAVTADEAYAAFLAALASNNIAVYQSGRYWKLIRTADAKKTPIPTYTGGGETPASEQPITKVIKLTYADADQVRGIMGNFISPQGADIQSIPPDTIILTDIGLNIRRIERLIESIDKAGAGDAVKIVQIRYATAKEIADKINQIFAQGGGPTGKPGSRRTMLSSPTAAPRPVVPGQAPAPAPAPAPTPAGGAIEIQVTKIIPDERTNKLIIIADDKSFERIMELIGQLDVPTAAGGGIHVVFLKNANAEELATTLSNLAQGRAGSGKSPAVAPPGVPGQPAGVARPPGAGAGAVTAELFTGDVKITSDKAQNALVIQASGTDFATVQKLIQKLDRPRRQVFIEAVIMEVNLRDDLQVGVGAHGAIPINTPDGTAFVPIGLTPGRINTLGPLSNVTSLVSLGGFLSGFSGPVSADLKALNLNLPSLGVMVQALQSSSDVNVLSTPHLLASDNEDSEITVGQNVPFQQGVSSQANLSGLLGATGASGALGGINSLLTNSFIPVQRQPVELRLKIKPQISEGDNVRLQLDEQIEEIASTDAVLGPTTSKRSVKTQIVARDQSTIVIGGLIQERNTRSVKKVPFLGSLPLIGWLFRDTVSAKQKTNLLLFLTPYIIRDESDYRRIYEKKRKEQEEFMEQFYGRRPGFNVQIDYARKAGPFSRLRRDVLEEVNRPENGGPGLPGERVVTPIGAAPDLQPSPPPAVAPVPPPSRLPAPPDGALEAPGEPLGVEPEVPLPLAPPEQAVPPPALSPPVAPRPPAPETPAPQPPGGLAPKEP